MTLHRSKENIAENCPVRDVLDRLGDRWTLLVITELQDGTLRFSKLKARIEDISQRMLAQTLRQLEKDGLVSRKVYPTIPPKVEYSLTALGTSMLEPIGHLIEWASKNHHAVRDARSRYVPPEAQAAF